MANQQPISRTPGSGSRWRSCQKLDGFGSAYTPLERVIVIVIDPPSHTVLKSLRFHYFGPGNQVPTQSAEFLGMALSSTAVATLEPDGRLSYQESMAFVELAPLPVSQGTSPVRRFMSTRPAYVATADYSEDSPLYRMHATTFGGHVYAQSGLVAYTAWKDIEDERGVKPQYWLGFHTIHGYFTIAGKSDRPFIYHVSPLTISHGLGSVSVTAYQPSVPSTNPQVDHFPLADGALPLEGASFTGICSFKLPESNSSGISTQEDSAQARFADVLSSRHPSGWPPCPIADIEAILEFADPNHVGLFPIVDMKKVDMTEYNKDKPVHEHRELSLYRILKPLPTDGRNANDHVMVHAFAADRNGLLMVGNHNGLGQKFGKAATISNSFVVHVNVDEAVMRHSEDSDGEDVWWVQELCFPRAGAGRGIVMNKIWSPRGVHVATQYQDGLVRSSEKGKL